MNYLPGFSVIITNFRHQSFLSDAIISVLKQEMDDEIEIIVMNDDPDFSLSWYPIVSNTVDITVEDATKRIGQAARINQGALLAKREFTAFLDADDEWLPWKLAVQKRYMDSSTIGSQYNMTYGDCIVLRGDNSRGYTRARDWDLDAAIKKQTITTFSSIVVRTEILRGTPFPENVGYGNDRVWTIDVARNYPGMAIKHIELPLFYYRDYSSQYGKFKAFNPAKKMFNLISRIQRTRKTRKLQRFIDDRYTKNS